MSASALPKSFHHLRKTKQISLMPSKIIPTPTVRPTKDYSPGNESETAEQEISGRSPGHPGFLSPGAARGWGFLEQV